MPLHLSRVLSYTLPDTSHILVTNTKTNPKMIGANNESKYKILDFLTLEL